MQFRVCQRQSESDPSASHRWLYHLDALLSRQGCPRPPITLTIALAPAPPTHPPALPDETPYLPACTSNRRSNSRPLSGADMRERPSHPSFQAHPPARVPAPNPPSRPTTTRTAAPSVPPAALRNSRLPATLRHSYSLCNTHFLGIPNKYHAYYSDLHHFRTKFPLIQTDHRSDALN